MVEGKNENKRMDTKYQSTVSMQIQYKISICKLVDLFFCVMATLFTYVLQAILSYIFFTCIRILFHVFPKDILSNTPFPNFPANPGRIMYTMAVKKIFVMASSR